MQGKVLCYLEYRQIDAYTNHDKFWSVVELASGGMFLRYGRIGTAGQTRAAAPAWRTKMREKVSEGYVEKTEAVGLTFDYAEGYASQTWQDAVDRAVAALSGGQVVNPLEAFQAEVVTAMQQAKADPRSAFESYGVLKAQMAEIKQSYDQCEGYLDTLKTMLVHSTGAAL